MSDQAHGQDCLTFEKKDSFAIIFFKLKTDTLVSDSFKQGDQGSEDEESENGNA